MATGSTARRIDDSPALEVKRPGFGGGDPPVPPIRPNAAVGNNAWLAVLMLLGAEAMFFAGLIGAYLVFRIGSAMWPPPFQPRLPLAVTGVNTIILLASALTMRGAVKAVHRGNLTLSIRQLGITSALGAFFLTIQGFEWVRLIHFGLTLSSSVYGGLFYTLIGFHAFHVVVGLIWLLIVLLLAKKGRWSDRRYVGVQTCAMYWTFVVALWPVLYGLVYLY